MSDLKEIKSSYEIDSSHHDVPLLRAEKVLSYYVESRIIGYENRVDIVDSDNCILSSFGLNSLRSIKKTL